VGDICLAHGVERKMVEKGRGYPFASLKPLLRRADIAFGNLECCLAVGGTKVAKKYNFRSHPRGAIALREAGFDVISLANNHSLDYGKPGLSETLANLHREGILAVGAGNTISSARRLRILKRNGLRIGFLAYLGLFPSIVKLTSREPAVAMADIDAVRREVRSARKRVDFLIVSMHAGKEYIFKHSPRQQEIAHAAIDCGADMVIGHHPHVVQDSEIYRSKLVFYSLGNFVFDPSPTFLKDRGKRWSGLVIATLEKRSDIQAKMIDLRIFDRQPQFADKEGESIACGMLGLDVERHETGTAPRHLKPVVGTDAKTHQR
jgi:poly-gamma-glutamate capsule biosynthesis protein CapA/YwtB (metallophosphatase superfamily)